MVSDSKTKKKKKSKDRDEVTSDRETEKEKRKTSKKDKKKRKHQGNDEEDSPKLIRKKKRDSEAESYEPEEQLDERSEVEKEGDFSKFRISSRTVQNLQERGIKYLFPIQAKTFNHVYDGEDVIGQARTGTGKTLSFALPITEKLQKSKISQKPGRPPMVLVMAPTRELAKQVSDQFAGLNSGLSMHCIYGGVPYEPQEDAIRRGLDVLIGTPGRILDHMNKGNLNLGKLRHVILDEVDRMLDMGFSESVEEILAASFSEDRKEKPQTLLFSATLPVWVRQTAQKYMKKDRKLVDLIGDQKLRTAVTVQHMAIRCQYHSRASTIGDVVQVYCGAHGRTMIFTETKKEANELVLNSVLKQETQVLHGDIPQKQREITLKSFRDGRFRCLVATDVAARGLDIPEVDLVVQCEPPKDVESYIHRAGRTGRAGREGICIIFYKPMQESQLQYVERKAGIKFKRIGAPQPSDIIKASAEDAGRFLTQVPDSVLEHFRGAAAKLVDSKGALDAVAAALAHISGTTEIKSRSLLSAQEGFTTYLLRTANTEMRSTAYMWRAIENNLPPHVKPEVRGMRLCNDRMAVVFDVPSKLDELIKESWSDNRGLTLELATELPELLERDPGFGGGGASHHGGRDGGRDRTFGHSRFRERYHSVSPRESPFNNRFGSGGSGSKGFADRRNGNYSRDDSSIRRHGTSGQQHSNRGFQTRHSRT